MTENEKRELEALRALRDAVREADEVMVVAWEGGGFEPSERWRAPRYWGDIRAAAVKAWEVRP